MKTPMFVLAALGMIGFTVAMPQEAKAGNVHFDIHLGIPAAVHAPHVVYVPHARVIHQHHRVHQHRHRHGYRHHHHHRRHQARAAHSQLRALGRIELNSRLYR